MKASRSFHRGSFKGKDSYPIPVIVWGSIGPKGYKIKLFGVKSKMYLIKSIQLLTDNEILTDLYYSFQINYVFQQDNTHTLPCIKIYKMERR